MQLVIPGTNLVVRLKRTAVNSIFLLFFFTFGLAEGWSQLDMGAIIGTVHDGQGAAVVGASVIIRNVATGVAATTRTKEGEFDDQRSASDSACGQVLLLTKLNKIP